MFRPYAVGLRGWYRVKTLWFSLPNYQGPVYIRGRQLDGPHTPVFGENPQLVDTQIPPEPTLNGSGGRREWPGGTWLRTPGCYAWQIDGTEFSKVVVFQAVFAPVARLRSPERDRLSDHESGVYAMSAPTPSEIA